METKTGQRKFVGPERRNRRAKGGKSYGATIQDIARYCGVSVSTVSRAVNGHQDINEKTRTKVMEAVRKYHYIPNNSARNLKIINNREIAIIIKGLNNPLFGSMVETFEAELAEQSYGVVTQYVEDAQDEIEFAIRLTKERKLAGIVFLGGFSLSYTPERFENLQVPFVFSTISLNAEMKRRYASVAVDDTEESCRLVHYLIENGHRRIAMICARDEEQGIGSLRRDGYVRALSEARIPILDELLIRPQTERAFSMENGYRSMQKLLSEKRGVTAVFAVSDVVAIGAAKASFDCGFRVPDDISIVGFDGLDIARFYHPSITTARQPAEKIARRSVRLLLSEIGGRSDEARNECLSCAFLSGASVKSSAER